MPPRARTYVAWRDVKPPQSSLQQGAFLDACTAWLIQEPSQSDDAILLPEHTTWTRAETLGPETTAERLSHTFAELRVLLHHKCSMCGDLNSVRPLVVNPFAQRCATLLCEGCRQMVCHDFEEKVVRGALREER